MRPEPTSDQSTSSPTIFIVDDDRGIRQGMELLMQSVGHACRTYPSGEDFLGSYDADRAGCLVLDIRMPGMDGLQLQQRLAELGSSLPIIFITGHGDVPMAVEAMQKGAVDFIQKPFRDDELLERIEAALETDRERRAERDHQAAVQERLGRLTKREHEVMELVVTGKPNKVIAYDLGVSQRTVEIHRARVMEKMEARSLAELVRMWLDR